MTMTQLLVILARVWPLAGTVVLPFLVNLIAGCSWPHNEKLWAAVGISILWGAVGAVAVVGLPSAAALTIWMGAMIVATQVCYRAFSAIGFTSKWLDLILEFGSEVVATT